mgnify:CR=1 FL=1
MNWIVLASVLLIAALIMNALALVIYGFMWFNFVICVVDAVLLIANFAFFFRKK